MAERFEIVQALLECQRDGLAPWQVDFDRTPVPRNPLDGRSIEGLSGLALSLALQRRAAQTGQMPSGFFIPADRPEQAEVVCPIRRVIVPWETMQAVHYGIDLGAPAEDVTIVELRPHAKVRVQDLSGKVRDLPIDEVLLIAADGRERSLRDVLREPVRHEWLQQGWVSLETRLGYPLACAPLNRPGWRGLRDLLDLHGKKAPARQPDAGTTGDLIAKLLPASDHGLARALGTAFVSRALGVSARAPDPDPSEMNLRSLVRAVHFAQIATSLLMTDLEDHEMGRKLAHFHAPFGWTDPQSGVFHLGSAFADSDRPQIAYSLTDRCLVQVLPRQDGTLEVERVPQSVPSWLRSLHALQDQESDVRCNEATEEPQPQQGWAVRPE